MGSAVLADAISAIRDWSVTEAKEPRGPRLDRLRFGSSAFGDARNRRGSPRRFTARCGGPSHTAKRSIPPSPMRSPAL
jgi:hypothetical protein